MFSSNIKFTLLVGAAVVVLVSGSGYAQNLPANIAPAQINSMLGGISTEAQTIVRKVLANHGGDWRKLCGQGESSVRSETRSSTMELAQNQDISSPSSSGPEAGAAIGKICAAGR